MAISDDSAAIAAATLAAAIVQAEGGKSGAGAKSDAIGYVMDLYRRSLNVVRNAASPKPGE